jgi:hypothetical protein
VLLENVLVIEHQDQVVFGLHPFSEARILPIYLPGDDFEAVRILIEP